MKQFTYSERNCLAILKCFGAVLLQILLTVSFCLHLVNSAVEMAAFSHLYCNPMGGLFYRAEW